MRVAKENDASMVEAKHIGKGLNNSYVLSFVIGGFGKEDLRVHEVVSGRVTENPCSGRRAKVATTSTIAKNE